MPLLTTTPISTSSPIMAMNEKLVPVNMKNQYTPTYENRMQVMIAEGTSTDSNSAAITR